MRCPNCNHKTACIDSRDSGATTRRRHLCNCGHRFTTYESPAPPVDVVTLANLSMAVRGEMMHLTTLFRQLNELLQALEKVK